MKHVSFVLPALALTLALPIVASAVEVTTLSGKLVDVATYVTHDHNMDSMHAMKGDAMKGDAMKGEAMEKACPTLGLVSDSGRVYLVSTQMGESLESKLCKKIDAKVSLAGKVFEQGGMSVLLVSALR
jgi:hypothetical protein